MKSPENNKEILTMKPIGIDSWSRPVYEDQYGRLWKDITLGSHTPELCSALNNAFDGEPDLPIRRPFFILAAEEEQVDKDKSFQYQLLDRFRCDFDYYLGYGNRNPDILPSKDEKEHIETMKRIWLSFPEEEKPEWLTWEQILEYEKAIYTKE
ncbi:hypothetical protein IMSAGC015_00645 [Lachnospiraceae bacterium]|jgi:hypothetical protein|nr:hypothetical protein IMSAGC015_00645 [Lachnospiraceae bacterium]